MKFSQRIGKTPAQKLAQKDGIDDELRIGLWNVLTTQFWDKAHTTYTVRSDAWPVVQSIWLYFFKKPLDEIQPVWARCLAEIKGYFFQAQWYEVYDFVEFLASLIGDHRAQVKFVAECNSQLEEENSAYRFVEDRIAEITSQEEIDSVEQAILRATPYGGVREHLDSALVMLSDKTHPDYRNSIKESISAVESLVKQIGQDDKAALGTLLKRLEKGKSLHPALSKAFSSLYGYTSDADGIRHALLNGNSTLSKADARFMLVCCSAFVNYVIDQVA